MNIRGFKAYVIMWPRYILVSFNFAETGWIFLYFCSRVCVSGFQSFEIL